MCQAIILNISERKRLKKSVLQFERFNGFSELTIPDRKRFLKKIKDFSNENIIISNQIRSMTMLAGVVKPYTNTSYYTAIPVIEKICRLIAARYLIELPYEEIYIMAQPESLNLIVPALMNIGKLFTVISENKDRKTADEIYFKYGCVIRWSNDLDNVCGKGKMLVRVSENPLPQNFDSPVLDLTNVLENRANVVNIRKILMSDDRLSELVRCWNGIPGIDLYGLMNILPDEKTVVDINIIPDEIFLLDTNAI